MHAEGSERAEQDHGVKHRTGLLSSWNPMLVERDILTARTTSEKGTAPISSVVGGGVVQEAGITCECSAVASLRAAASTVVVVRRRVAFTAPHHCR